MRVVRKMVSTILFLLILCSTFTALPISVGAVETSTPAYVSYQANRYSDSFQQIFGDGYNSYANTYYRTMKSNEKVVSGIAIWEAAHIATSPTYSVESGLITKEDMYKTAIFDMLDVTESNSFASNLFNILQDTRMSYMFSVAKTACDEKDIKVEELKNFEVNAEYINFLKDAAKLSKALNVVDKISKVVSGCSNLYDAVCTMASYQAISDMKDGTKEILTAIANDNENPADLRSAARGCVSAFDDGYGSILSAMENASKYVQATIKTIMDEAIDTIWGEVISGIPGGKVVFGTVKGMRVLSNEIFKMDDTCRVYYQFEADVTLENAIRKCMNNAKYDYMQDKNQSNAVTYMRAVDMYKRIVLQGYDYSIDMLTVKANAPSTKWFDWFNHSYSDCMEMIDKIEQSKNDRKNLYEQFEDWVHSDYVNLYCDNYDDTMNKLNNQKPIYATSVTLTQIKDINIGDSGYIYDYIKKTCVPENSVENKKKYFVADNKDIITLDRYGCFTVESSGQVTLTYDKGGDLETSITINIGSTKTDNTYDYTKEFQYKTNYNEENHRDEVTITKYIGTRSNVIIPYSIDGNVVTDIGHDAFKDCTSLTSIIIPNIVTYIGHDAFENCSSLKSIVIPNSVTRIGGWTFQDCTSLVSITIPDSVTYIGESAFSGCISLTSIKIPDSVTYINSSVFSGCTSLTSITIPNGVTSIGWRAFEYCKSLTDITLPNSITILGGDAFCYCTSLTSITIPDSVISIDGAFRGCISLTSIIIPNSVTSIGKDAFEYCNNLKNILYSGSKEEWNSIKIGEDNSCLTNADIHYNSEFVETVSPTCVEKGYDFYTCSECKDGVKINFVDPLGHSFVNGVCERCGKNKADLVESLHPYEDYTDKTYTIHKDGAKRIAVVFSESTETESGCDYISIYDKDNNMVGQYSGTELSGKRIVVRGDTVIIKLTSDGSNNYYGFSVTDVIPYYDECNHKTSEIRNSKAETCGDDGYTGDLVCTECELVLKKGEVIPATGKHDFEDTVYNATCVDEGYTVHRCKNCDYSYTDSYVDATGEHKYKDGICETCGRPDIDNLEKINGSDTKNIEIENEGDCKYFKFTPEKDGTLKIYSTGTYDTYGYLYDSNMGLLSSNDDGEDSNFSITYDVTAGKTYVIGCKMYSSSIGSFDLVVNFEPNNTYKIGDANGDEIVTVADITVIQKYLANRLQLSDERLIACDVNKDGVVTIEDATLIQKYLIHLVPSLN